jgi:hypothetical protein
MTCPQPALASASNGVRRIRHRRDLFSRRSAQPDGRSPGAGRGPEPSIARDLRVAATWLVELFADLTRRYHR